MGRIHQLSPVLANQIAAGEVVERPASVVKELVENAIDADSQAIDIVINAAGFDQIQVIDDGHGIANDDVKTAFLRHATSKISDRRDLFNVHFLGFRGEALPSIASVADVTLKTSTGSAGTEIHIRGGKLLAEKPAASRKGTAVTVRDLFYNTPARLKYMKSPATELSKITDIIDRIALGHPEIAFSLTHNGRELLRTSGRNNLQQVLGSIYGNAKVKKMLPIKAHDLDFHINGYFSLPELTRASRNYISIIINGRFVKNHELSQAVIAGYGSKLMVGRYPLAVIRIQTDPILIDANVHPTKQTVRISKEEQLGQLITKSIRAVLSKQNLIPHALDRQGAVQPKYVERDLNLKWHADPKRDQSPSTTPALKNATSNSSTDRENPSSLPDNVIIKTKADLKSPQVAAFDQYYQHSSHQAPFDSLSSATSLNKTPVVDSTDSANSKRMFPHLIYIGQMHGTYLIAESDDGMYIIDQHAAQERINYEKFRHSIGEVSADQQNLLVPIVLEYSNPDVIRINERLDILKGIGIDLEPFGKNSFIIHHHPSWFPQGAEEATLRELIDAVLQQKHLSIAQFRAQTAITMSCKRAIKANHHLDRYQAEALLAKLQTTEDPFNCPHGRPVLVHFSNYDMQRMFRRVQDNHHSRKKE